MKAEEIHRIFIPEHYHRAQTKEQQEVSNFWVLQSTLSQISEQGKASYTPTSTNLGANNLRSHNKNISTHETKSKESTKYTKSRFTKTAYLRFCYVGWAVRIHYGFEVRPPPNSYTFTYL